MALDATVGLRSLARHIGFSAEDVAKLSVEELQKLLSAEELRKLFVKPESKE